MTRERATYSPKSGSNGWWSDWQTVPRRGIVRSAMWAFINATLLTHEG